MSRKKGLGQQAHEPIPEGETYEPYTPADESRLEFTIKAAVPGILFGIVFGAANAYLGLQAGLTISTSIPVAVMTVAAFRALRGLGLRATILEANISQTIGSAWSSVASGVIFTLPALFLWGLDPALAQMTMLAMFGGLLGVLFMMARLPWMFVGIGVSIALMAEALRVPSLPFVVGVYLPVTTMVPVFLGGALRWLLHRGARSREDKNERRERGVLFGSGLVGGEGLLSVAIAGVVFYQDVHADDPTADQPLPWELGQDRAARLGEWLSLPVATDVAPSLLGLAGFFASRCRTTSTR